MAAGDLTTLDAVHALRQKHGVTDPDDDLLITSLITAASAEITKFTGREFVASTRPEAREFVAAGSLVDLVPCDLRSVTKVEDVTDAAAPVVISGYRLRPKPARYGVYSWMEVPKLAPGSEVAVTGLWGFAEIPEDVKHWAGITVVQWIRGDVAAFSTTFTVDDGRLQRPEALPSAVRSALCHYRRKPV